jgi:hypothetical protein
LPEQIRKYTWLSKHREHFQACLENLDNLKDFSLKSIADFIMESRQKEVLDDIDESDDDNIIESDHIKELKVQFEYVNEVKDIVPEYGILAWDMARYVNLLKMCYIADYLDADRCWTELEKISSLCFENFHDWDNFGRSFLIGRNFWMGKDEDIDEGPSLAVKRLLEHWASPWKYFLWPEDIK